MAIYVVQSDDATARAFATLKRRLSGSLFMLVGWVGIFSLGFAVIHTSHDSKVPITTALFDGLWETINLVSTVGSLPEMGVPERIWAIITIVVGLGAVLHSFAVVQALFHVDAAGLIERRRMARQIGDLNGHIIVCGYGRVGQAVAESLSQHKAPIVVIDKQPEVLQRITDSHIFPMQGDCTDEKTLLEAGLERARGLIATLDSDASNVFLILIVREIRPDIHIVTRAERHETRSAVLRAGANRAIVPGELAAQQLSHLMMKPNVSEFIASAIGGGEYDFAEVHVAEHSHLAGQSLAKLALPRTAQAIVISIVPRQGNPEFNPDPSRVLEPDDTLLIVSRKGGLDRIARLSEA